MWCRICLSFREHEFTLVFSGVCVAPSLVFLCSVCTLLFVLCLSAVVLSLLLLFVVSGYPFGSIKHCLATGSSLGQLVQMLPIWAPRWSHLSTRGCSSNNNNNNNTLFRKQIQLIELYNKNI